MVKLDCSGHLCPVPILMTEEKMKALKKNDILDVQFTDPGAGPDLRAWCRATDNEMLGLRNEDKKNFAYIRKQGS